MLKIVSEDITEMEVDAVVNAANESLMGGGGVDEAIHRAAGPDLDTACKEIGSCPTGEAVITWAYDMEYAIYIIHTVGPVWNGGNNGEEKLLRSCYKNVMEIAKTHGCRSLAFPLVSGGVYGYPKEAALDIAVEEITNALTESEDIECFITLTDKEAFAIAERKYGQYLFA